MNEVTELHPARQDDSPPDAWAQLREVGLSYRQFDYWTRTGLIAIEVPEPGSGNRRRVSAEEVEIVREMFRFVMDGIDPRTARKYAETLQSGGTVTIGGYIIRPRKRKTT